MCLSKGTRPMITFLIILLLLILCGGIKIQVSITDTQDKKERKKDDKRHTAG